MLRSLQRRAGNAAVGSLVPARGAQPTIQRITDEEKKLLADEERAWNAAKAKVGAPALFVTHEDPDVAVRLHDRQPETSTLTVGNIVDRNGGDPARKSFDSAGAAAALAAMIGGPAIAFKQDRFYFAASLSGNGGMVRDKVWKVISRFAIDAAIGDDGLQYPLGTPLVLPKGDERAEFEDVDRAAPVDAAGMRKIAGVKSDEDWAAETAAAQQAKAEGKAPPDPKNPERARIPPERQEAFIEAYFRARASEVLGNNLRQVMKLEADFKPGGSSGDTKDVSPGAKALIDATKDQAAKFREVLEDEALAQRYYHLLMWRQSAPSGAEVTVEGKKVMLAVVIQELKLRIDAAKEKKDDALSRSPMLAMMVERERVGAGGTLKVAGENAEMFWKSEIEKPTVAGKNQYDVSAFGQGASDEALRKEFFEKLCAVEKAVREAGTKVLGGDAGFLYGMAGLRTMVLADLAGNPELRAKADEILKTRDIVTTVVNIVNATIQIGLLFVPGVGPLLSAAAGLAESAQQANQSLEQWNVSKATLDPTKALVDQQQASDSLFWDTVFLAAAAADFGSETVKSLAKGGQALTEAEQIARKHGARPYAQAKASKLAREAEERKLWQAPDPEAAKELAVKLVKPEAQPLEKEFVQELATLGINVSEKGVVTGHGELSILGRAKRSWTRVRGVLLNGKSAADKKMGEYLMWTMIAFRKNSSKEILEASMAEVIAKYPGEVVTLEIKPTGAVGLMSDADWTVSGPHASEVVEAFNRRFRKHIVDCESATAFDTNVYTRPAFLDTPFDVAGGPGGRKLDPVRDAALIADQDKLWKEFANKARAGAAGAEGAEVAAKSANIDAILAEAEKLYPDDFRARMAHVNNFNQETAGHMKAADTMLAKGKEGLAEWAAYKDSMLKNTPPANRAHQLAVLQEAEARFMSYQQQILLEINKNRPKSEWITPEQLTEYTAKKAGDEAYERVVAARTRIYERKLGKVSTESKAYAETRKKFEALRQVWQSGKATPEQEAELLRLQGQLHAQAAHTGAMQSEALYFAAEGYQAQGSYQLVVQNGKKLTGVVETPAYGSMLSAQARDACYELLGFVLAHSGSELDDILASSKNLQRASYAYLSHPLAKGGSPGVLGLAGQVMVEKANRNLDAAKALVTARYGMAEKAAMKAFARDMQAAGAQLRGQMARVSGQPVKEIEEAWMRAVQSGASKTLLMYASLATSKAGAADRGTGGD